MVIARVAPKMETAMRVVIGRAARAASSGLSEPSVSRVTISAWWADHRSSVRWASRRHMRIEMNHRTSHEARKTPRAASDPETTGSPG